MTEQKVPLSVMEQDKEILISVFKDGEVLMKTLRNLFCGFPVTEGEKMLVKSIFSTNPELRLAVRRKIYPQLEDTAYAPSTSITDYWASVEKEIFGAHEMAIFQKMESKRLVEEKLKVALFLLEDPDGQKVDLSLKSIDVEPFQQSLLARCLFMRTISQGLQLIGLVADKKEETAEERKESAKKDSSK